MAEVVGTMAQTAIVVMVVAENLAS